MKTKQLDNSIQSPLHGCIGNIHFSLGGTPSFELCIEEKNGTLWKTGKGPNEQLNECPYCGYKAKKLIEEEDGIVGEPRSE